MVITKMLFQVDEYEEKNEKKSEENILICKGVKFYARKDEDAFFDWIKKLIV